MDHRQDNGSTLHINGSPVTENYDNSIRLQVNGYHQRVEIQKNREMEQYCMGPRPSLRTKHFKLVHEALPLGI